MASVIRQPLLSLTSKILQKAGTIAAGSGSRLVTAPQIATRGLTLTRSFWCVSSANTFKTHKVNTLSGCCNVHTKGDEEFVKFLGQEINDEQKIEEPRVTQVKDWNHKTNGTNVTLTKKFNDETITVEFDVNNSVDTDDHIFDEPESAERSEAPSMVSKPPFDVKIVKKSGKCLVFMCEFNPESDEMEQGEDKHVEDLYSIVEVRMDSGKEGDSNYVLAGSVMDGVMYDLLMDMLFERGVDDEFVTNLVDFSTSFERDQYIDLLENLKNFISDK